MASVSSAGQSWRVRIAQFDEAHLNDAAKVLAHTVGIDVLYGDQEGGQRTITRCLVLPASDDGWYVQVARHWQIDRDEPR